MSTGGKTRLFARLGGAGWAARGMSSPSTAAPSCAACGSRGISRWCARMGSPSSPRRERIVARAACSSCRCASSRLAERSSRSRADWAPREDAKAAHEHRGVSGRRHGEPEGRAALTDARRGEGPRARRGAGRLRRRPGCVSTGGSASAWALSGQCRSDQRCFRAHRRLRSHLSKSSPAGVGAGGSGDHWRRGSCSRAFWSRDPANSVQFRPRYIRRSWASASCPSKLLRSGDEKRLLNGGACALSAHAIVQAGPLGDRE